MDFGTERRLLIKALHDEGITHPDVLTAMLKVPRHLFVPAEEVHEAYHNKALYIGEGQTISQPVVVAEMTELLLGNKHRLHKVLEIGTGSGYQAAILSQLVDEVYTIERIESLHKTAQERFHTLNYGNIHTRFADGREGWVGHECYEGIIITASTPTVPQPFLDQLCIGGHLIVPLGDPAKGQSLQRITRMEHGYEKECFASVLFVPLEKGKISLA